MPSKVDLDEFQELALLVLAYGGARLGESTRGAAAPTERVIDSDTAALLSLRGLAQRRGEAVHLTDTGLDRARSVFPEQQLRSPMYS